LIHEELTNETAEQLAHTANTAVACPCML